MATERLASGAPPVASRGRRGAPAVSASQEYTNASAAVQAIAEQLSRTSETCGLCGLSFASESELRFCQRRLTNRMITLLRRRHVAFEALRGTEQSLPPEDGLQHKVGRAMFARKLKTAVLTKRQCPACQKAFDTDYIAHLLSQLDRMAAAALSGAALAPSNLVACTVP